VESKQLSIAIGQVPLIFYFPEEHFLKEAYPAVCPISGTPRK
jgi:hypothetical protein